MTDAPAHAIRQIAFKQVKPSLAHTLTECLFWYQKATHTIDGRRAVWKTGPELEEALGIASRTAHKHLKKLEGLGYWKVVLKPRPGSKSPSPVNWLIPSEWSLNLLREASELAAAGTKGRVKSRAKGHSKVENSNLQTSPNETPLQLPSLPLLAPDFSFSPEKTGKPKTKSDFQKQAGQEASEEVKAFVARFQKVLIQKMLPVWNLDSKFP